MPREGLAARSSAPGARDDQPDLPMFASLVESIVGENPGTFREGFAAYLRENGPLWERFEREALKLWHKGRRHYGARTIIEFLRHETAVSDSSAQFKINDHCVPDFARLFLLRHPQCEGLFSIRGRGRSDENDRQG